MLQWLIHSSVRVVFRWPWVRIPELFIVFFFISLLQMPVYVLRLKPFPYHVPVAYSDERGSSKQLIMGSTPGVFRSVTLYEFKCPDLVFFFFLDQIFFTYIY